MIEASGFDQLHKKGLKRQLKPHLGTDERLIQFEEGACVNFTSNDYLGISKHPDVIEAFKEAADIYGLGSGSSPAISGYTQATSELELLFARLNNRPRAMFFNSGYHANLAVMNCFTNRHTSVVADKHIHASLLDGIQQSRARLKRFTHNDADSAYRLLAPIQSDKILVAESVYSMEGDIAPLDDLIKVAQTTQARLVIDDAHGFGIIGTNYGGIMDRKAVNNEDVSIVITPFGKAIGGAGAMVTGKDEDIEILLQWARSYRYSTALPIPIVVALQSALQVWYHEKWRAEQLKANIDRFLSLAHDFGIEPVSTSQTPIMSFIVGDNHRSCALQKLLLEEGFYVSCIRPPTVPEGTARLRITLTAFHTYDDLWRLVNTLAKHL